MTGIAARRVVAFVTVTALVVPLLPAHAADGVRTSTAVETSPSAGPGMIAWTQSPRSNPQQTKALLKHDGNIVRLSSRGTKGFTAGGAIDEGGGRVAYWEHVGGKGNIKIYSVKTRRRGSPDFINTARHEWGAAISGARVLFARGRYGGPMHIFLANLDTRTVRRLARVNSSGYLQPGDISGRWVTWTRCAGFRNCRVVRYNIASGSRVVLSNPMRRSQFSSSVLRNGTVFYGESGNFNTCNTTLRIFKKPRSSERRRLTTLPSGTSIAYTSVRRLTSSRVAVFYDQIRCDAPRANIYRIRVSG